METLAPGITEVLRIWRDADGTLYLQAHGWQDYRLTPGASGEVTLPDGTTIHLGVDGPDASDTEPLEPL